MCYFNSMDESSSDSPSMTPSAIEESDDDSSSRTAVLKLRKVRFQVISRIIPSHSEEDVSNMWYQPNDLEVFRNEARDMCRQMRETTVTTEKQVQMARDCSSRGLEQRSCLERQRRRYLANRCIVRASRKFSHDKLAILATNCTSWAAALAKEEGSRDYVRAYHMRDELDEPQETVIVAAPSRKRRQSPISIELPIERRMRPRFVLIE